MPYMMVNEPSSHHTEWDEIHDSFNGFRSTPPVISTGRYPLDMDYLFKNEDPSPKSFAMSDPALSGPEVYNLVQRTVKDSRLLMQKSLYGDEPPREAIQLKLTIDLTRCKIQTLPDEAFDLLRQDAERLILSHNQIFQMPPRLADCTGLTCLNLRDNCFREFPKPVYKLHNLEILDLNKNRLHRVPEEIKELKALRLLNIMNNNLETIPFCIGHMDNLKVVKLGNNPLNDGLREIYDSIDGSPSAHAAGLKEFPNEKDGVITTRMKKYLLDEAASLESGGESSSEGPLDTPRPPRRTNSVRFPVVPSASGSESAPDMRSPIFPKAAVPPRSHYRVASGQSSFLQTAAQRRPGVTPLIIGNERNRSNSESILQATQNMRLKRMAVMPRKTSDLSILEEGHPRRLSVHFRGMSHGSVLKERQMHGVTHGSTSSISHSPSENDSQRGIFVRRLSSLPENKRESKTPSQVVEGAKSILYSLHQVHPQMFFLITSLKNGVTKRSGLERIYHSTKIYVEQLDHELHGYESRKDPSEETKERALRNISTQSQACIRSFQHVCNLLLQHADQLGSTVDQRYVRTLFLLVYGSLVEAQIACTSARSRPRHKKQSSLDFNRPTISVTHEDSASSSHRSITPTKARPMPPKSLRKETSSSSIRSHNHNPYISSNMPQSAVPLYLNGRSRSNSRSNTLTTSSLSSLANTPRSGESFLVPETPIESPEHDGRPPYQYSQETQQDMLFERIYLAFFESIDAGLRTVPKVSQQAKHCFDDAKVKYNSRPILDLLSRLIQACRAYLDMCDTLKARLQSVKLKEPEVRGSPAFWKLCLRYVKAFVRLGDEVRGARKHNLLTPETGRLLLPVHQSVKSATAGIRASPWSYVLSPSFSIASFPTTTMSTPLSNQLQEGSSTGTPVEALQQQQPPQMSWEEGRRTAAGNANYPQRFRVAHDRSRGGSSSSNSLYAPSVPATPLFAALGPAAQATIPSTPLFFPAGSSEAGGGFGEEGGGGVYQRSGSPALGPQGGGGGHGTFLHRR